MTTGWNRRPDAAATPSHEAQPGRGSDAVDDAGSTGPAVESRTGTQPFSHLDVTGQAHMVDVTEKQSTVRSATGTGFVRCSPDVVAALRDGTTPKGDVLAVARVAGIQATKHTPDLLPLTHVVGVHGATVDLWVDDDGVGIEATVRTADRTGVEMEALTAVSVAALAVVDMVKGLDKSVSIEQVQLQRKTGGKSGDWVR